jgi:hypothetical protein
MNNLTDILWMVLAAVAAVAMIFVVRARRVSHGTNLRQLAEENCCDHLRPALEMLLSRGHELSRVGQKMPDYPLEIHFKAAFDPVALKDELKLEDPVFLSETRNVLFCKADGCELDPRP